MRGKWLIAGIAIILGILSIRQLSYTWYTQKIEKEASNLAQNDAQEQLIIDSLANDTLNLGIIQYNYRDAKEKEIKLGLDLKGGISVILQVQVRDLLESLANHSENPIFVEALNSADIKQRTQGNRAYVDIFYDEFERLRTEKNQPGLKYSSPDIFGNRQNANLISFNSSDEDVQEKIKKDIDSNISTAYQVISSRINRFGVAGPMIQRLGGRADARILVELAGDKNKGRVATLIQSTAKLDSWQVEATNPQANAYSTALKPQSPKIKTERENLQSLLQPA